MNLKKIVSALTLACYSGFSLAAGDNMTPVGQCAQNDPSACVVQEAPISAGTPQQQADQRAAMMRALRMDGRIIRNDTSAIVLQIPQGMTGNTIYRFSKSPPIVWGRYNPLDATGRIDVSYFIRTPRNTVQLVLKHFTPHDGLNWIAHGDLTNYVHGQEGIGGTTYFFDGPVNIGFNALNPFDNKYTSFEGGDGNFHNITQNAFLTVVGMASKRYGATRSFTAIAQARQEQHQSTSGDIFSQTQTTTVDTYVKPYWLFGNPIELGGPDRFSPAFCIDPAQKSNCPERLTVKSGISFIPFNGGNMPMQESLMDEQVDVQSKPTMFTYMVATTLLTWGAASVLTGAAGFGAGASAAADVAGTTAASSLGGATYGAIAGAGYAAGSMLGASGSSPFQAQNGFMGNVGAGAGTSGFTGNFGDPTKAITQRYVNPAPGNVTDLHGGTTAPTQIYQGSCPQQYSAAQCKAMGYTPQQIGLIQRADTFKQYNGPAEMANGHMPQKTVPVAPIDPYALINGKIQLQQ